MPLECIKIAHLATGFSTDIYPSSYHVHCCSLLAFFLLETIKIQFRTFLLQ